MTTPIALSIAGSDPSGGAGIQADLKTFHTHGVFGMAVVTLITVQNTCGVRQVDVLAPQLVAAQLDALLDDVAPGASKTGALGSAAVIEALAARLALRKLPLVIDPVLTSTSGARLLDADGVSALKRLLIPHAALVTPNLDEAELLLGARVRDIDAMRDAARALVDLGARAALVKGGHGIGDAIDILFADGVIHELHATRVTTNGKHGLGCALSAAITAQLARGESVLDACRLAKEWLTRALASAPELGTGRGPINHFEPPPAHPR